MSNNQPDDKKSWEPMELKHAGDVGDVLQQGGAKLSTDAPEPGELSTKPPGQ